MGSILKIIRKILLFSAILLLQKLNVNAQMRQVYLDNFTAGNQISKISFYNNTSGFVAFRDWIGFSSDTGRTFTQKNITNGNTNLNGYNVNILFGFGINGVKAFDQNNIIAYGDYGFVPAILKSTDGGNTFTVRYHSQFNNLELRTGITDIIFPQNNSVGYAVDADRVLKTNDQGLNWVVIKIDPARYFTNLEAVDNNIVFAISTKYETNKVYRTVNGGTTWQDLPLPAGAATKVRSVFFLDTNTGWINMYDNDHHDFVYKTTNAGVSWVLQNNVYAHSVSLDKFRFIDANVGYGISYQNIVFKTLNSGAIWEPLPRDNNYTYLGYSHNDLQCLSATQLWAGGGHGFLEMSNNAGGTPIPQAYFLIDTVGVSASNNVNLTNYSRTGYTYKWYKNNSYIGNTFNANYSHNINSYVDSIKLVVFNGVRSDSTTKYQYFNVPAPPTPTITSFNPLFGNTGNTINIYGTNFIGVSAVKFGGVNATSFTIISPTQIAAILDSGATGFVKVTTAFGSDSLTGFEHLRPSITSFSPTSGGPGSVITINGSGFNLGIGQIVKFGGTVASSFLFNGSTSLNAVVGNGSSGNITFTTSYGTATIAGFTYIPPPPPPIITSFTPTQAPQGNIVTITGTNFINVTSVKFGSTAAASFNVVSPTSITAVVGAGSSGSVFVTTGTGTDSLAGFVYTTPIITNVLPSIGSTGTVVNIYGSNFNGTTSVTFGGTAAASFVINSATNITAIVGAGSTGNVTIISPNGTVNVGGFVFVSNSVPIINSFNPIAGPVGSTVQIIGTGFSTIAANNIVYFGATKASVSAATPTLLNVIVPSGATYQNISVTNNGLTGFSNFAFTVTFPNGILTENTFSDSISFGTKYRPQENTIEDLDGDRLPDVIIASQDTLSIYKNTSVLGSYSLGNRLDISMYAGFVGGFVIADIDGDGKKDILFSNNNTIYFHKNTSTMGNLSFSNSQNIGQGDVGKIADFNNDGKLDLITLTGGSSFKIQVNTSIGGVISFAAAAMFSATNNFNTAFSFTIADFDSDGKQDIAMSNYYTQGIQSLQNTAVTIFKNISNGNSLSFFEAYNFGLSGIYVNIMAKDIDADGKTDLIYDILGYYDYQTNSIYQTDNTKISILRNTSTNNILSFTHSLLYINSNHSFTTAYGDLNGDSKVDIASYSGSTQFSTLENSSTVGNISANGLFEYSINNFFGTYRNISVADMNADSKPDLILCNFNSSKVYIFKNKDSAISLSVCANTNKIINSNITGSTYQWQVNTGLGFINITDGVNYSGTNTHDLQITNTPISFNNYKYKCIVGSSSSSIFILTVNSIVVPTINLFNSDTTICASSSLTFTANSSNGGLNPIYQWQVNGVNSGNNAAIFITNNLTNNSQIKCILTSNALCATPPTATSNIVNVSVNPTIVPTVSIASSTTNICVGTPITFTATSTNAGINPLYQWQVNGVNVGLNSNSFTSSALGNNDQVKCVLSSSATCANPQILSSNVIIVTVNQVVSPTISITTSAINICIGSSATFTATITNGGTNPSYQWQLNGANVGTNSNIFSSSTLSNNDQVKCILTSNAICATQQLATSNVITVSVSSTIIPSVNISSTTTTICNGTAIIFTSTPTNGGIAPSYQWQVNGTNVGINSNTFSSSTLTNASVVRVIMTSSLACATPQTATSNPINITVNNTIIPTASFTTSATTICNGASITFISTSINTGTSPIYQWKKNGINVGTNSATYTNNSFLNGDAITLTLTSNATCTSNLPIVSNPVIISVTTEVPTITISGNTNVIINNPTNILSIATFGGTLPIYKWQDSTNLHTWSTIIGATNSSLLYTPTVTGNKLRCLMTSNSSCVNGVISSSNILSFIVATGVVSPNPTGAVTLKFFPNPVHNILTIDSLQLSKEWESLNIISSTGNTILMGKEIVGKTKITIDVSSFISGFYLIVLRRKQGVPYFLKFIKE
jgi:photosystem II stability/assembly factor-like uncharacterized protein